MSDLRAEASRQNGEKSEGPITAEGKARSSLNALKLGIFSQNRFISGEKPEDFEQLREQIASDVRAQGVLELCYVDEIAFVIWKKKRLNQGEAATIEKERIGIKFSFEEHQWSELSGALAIRIKKYSEEDQERLKVIRDDLAVRTRASPHDDEKFNRVAVSLDRSLERALRGLQAAQQLRRGSIEAIIVNPRPSRAGRRKPDDESCEEGAIVG